MNRSLGVCYFHTNIIQQQMGSGLSLSHKQVVAIIERELQHAYQELENMRPRTTPDGYEIYYDFSEEVSLNQTIQDLRWFSEHTRHK